MYTNIKTISNKHNNFANILQRISVLWIVDITFFFVIQNKLKQKFKFFYVDIKAFGPKEVESVLLKQRMLLTNIVLTGEWIAKIK